MRLPSGSASTVNARRSRRRRARRKPLVRASSSSPPASSERVPSGATACASSIDSGPSSTRRSASSGRPIAARQSARDRMPLRTHRRPSRPVRASRGRPRQRPQQRQLRHPPIARKRAPRRLPTPSRRRAVAPTDRPSGREKRRHIAHRLNVGAPRAPPVTSPRKLWRYQRLLRCPRAEAPAASGVRPRAARCAPAPAKGCRRLRARVGAPWTRASRWLRGAAGCGRWRPFHGA